MKCVSCSHRKHSRCSGGWCDCCGENPSPLGNKTSLSPPRSSNKGGKGRSARSGPAPQPRKKRPKRTFGPCSIDGCPKIEKEKGLCAAHAERLRRYGDPTYTPENKGRTFTTPPEVRAQIVALLASGKGQSETARTFGVSRDIVRSAATAAGGVCAHAGVSAKMAFGGIAED